MANSEIIGAGQDTARPAPKKYQIIYADPPWKCDILRTGTDKARRFDHYKTMKTEDICKMQFDFFDENAVLFMWSTNTFLPDAIRVMSAWGFKYHCCIVWKKNNGITMRGFHRTVEFLLFGYNGKFPDIFRGNPFPCFVSVDRLKHSEKPKVFRELIRDKFKGDAIELFARQRVEGWDAWGNEIEESPVLVEECPAQNTKEICHTAPNSASAKAAQVTMDLEL